MEEYVSNARALLDSLNHYEFLKARTVLLRSDLRASQLEKLGLKSQIIRGQLSLDSCRTEVATLPKLQAKLKSARTENWVWRGVGLLTLLDLSIRLVNAFK